MIGGRRVKLASLCPVWLTLAAFAAPHLAAIPWEPDGPVLLAGGEASRPVAPGEQYPPSPADDALAPAVQRPAEAAAPARPSGADWRLSVDLSVTADSNVTNGTRLHTVPIDLGEGVLPVPVDPNLREKADVGTGVSAAAAVRLPVASGAALALDAEGYRIDYGGERSDDGSLQVAGGLEFGPGEKPDGLLQLIAFERWYGGVEALQGLGLRGNWRFPVAEDSNLRLAVDGRIFESGYGEAFGGSEASVYLSYDTVLGPRLSASAGLYAHRQWLRDDAFSSLDYGLYGGLSFYLGEALAGGATAGLSRARFDEPLLLLDPAARRDWRLYTSLWLTTRKPVGWGLHPSLTYTYNRTASSIGYYDSDRHRLRLGLQRRF